MFDFAKWVVDNLISGVKNGAFPREWAAVQLGNYFARGKVTEADIEAGRLVTASSFLRRVISRASGEREQICSEAK